MIPARVSASAEWTCQFRTYLELAALDSAVPRARLHACRVVAERGLPELRETVKLVTSELVTNSVRASARLARPVVRLRVDSDLESVTVSVWDASSAMPVRQHSSPDDEDGRGLMLVEALSDEWGFYLCRNGKVTWALINH